MMIDDPHAGTGVKTLPWYLVRLAAATLLAAIVVLLARTYVGHSPGPYGVCTTPDGRSVTCDAVKR
jgi:hypothetical protein